MNSRPHMQVLREDAQAYKGSAGNDHIFEPPLREIFDRAPALVYLRNQLTGGIVWCNRATEEAFGLPAETIYQLGNNLFEKILYPDDFYLAALSNQHYQEKDENFAGVIRVRRADSNTYRWFTGVSTPFRYTAEGKVWLTLCVFIDFTSAVYTQPQLSEALHETLTQRYKNIHDSLTPREKEIIKLLVAGYTTKQIAKELYLSSYTVEGYRKSIRLKLNVNSTPQLVALAKQIGLE